MQIKKFLCLILVMVSITSYVYAMDKSSVIAEKIVCDIKDFLRSENAPIKPNAAWKKLEFYTSDDHIIKELIFEHYQDICTIINNKDAYAAFVGTFDKDTDTDIIHANMIQTVLYLCLHVSENVKHN